MPQETPARRRPTQFETRTAIRELEEALESIQNYRDPENENCSVPADAREAGKLYLGSWVEDPIERALDVLKRSQEGGIAARNDWELRFH